MEPQSDDTLDSLLTETPTFVRLKSAAALG
jgi:hypothetical protein